MGWSILADAVLVLHGAFIAWATLGALAVWRWPVLVWAHLPALAWGVWIEASAGICPLTPLESVLRQRAGQRGYEGSFIVSDGECTYWSYSATTSTRSRKTAFTTSCHGHSDSG